MTFHELVDPQHNIGVPLSLLELMIEWLRIQK